MFSGGDGSRGNDIHVVVVNTYSYRKFIIANGSGSTGYASGNGGRAGSVECGCEWMCKDIVGLV